MDRDDGFPPHIIGFMKRKREKEAHADPHVQARSCRDDQNQPAPKA